MFIVFESYRTLPTPGRHDLPPLRRGKRWLSPVLGHLPRIFTVKLIRRNFGPIRAFGRSDIFSCGYNGPPCGWALFWSLGPFARRLARRFHFLCDPGGLCYLPSGRGMRGKMFNRRAAFFARDLRHLGSLPGDFPSASRLCSTISFIAEGCHG